MIANRSRSAIPSHRVGKTKALPPIDASLSTPYTGIGHTLGSKDTDELDQAPEDGPELPEPDDVEIEKTTWLYFFATFRPFTSPFQTLAAIFSKWWEQTKLHTRGVFSSFTTTRNKIFPGSLAALLTAIGCTLMAIVTLAVSISLSIITLPFTLSMGWLSWNADSDDIHFNDEDNKSDLRKSIYTMAVINAILAYFAGPISSFAAVVSQFSFGSIILSSWSGIASLLNTFNMAPTLVAGVLGLTTSIGVAASCAIVCAVPILLYAATVLLAHWLERKVGPVIEPYTAIAKKYAPLVLTLLVLVAPIVSAPLAAPVTMFFGTLMLGYTGYTFLTTAAPALGKKIYDSLKAFFTKPSSVNDLSKKATDVEKPAADLSSEHKASAESKRSPSPAPAPVPTVSSPAPAPAPTASSPAPAAPIASSPAPAPAPIASSPAPAPAPTASSPAPAPAPIASSPAPAPVPTASSPAPAPAPTASSPAPAPAPTASSPAPAPAPTASSPAPAPSPIASSPAPAPLPTASSPGADQSSKFPAVPSLAELLNRGQRSKPSSNHPISVSGPAIPTKTELVAESKHGAQASAPDAVPLQAAHPSAPDAVPLQTAQLSVNSPPPVYDPEEGVAARALPRTQSHGRVAQRLQPHRHTDSITLDQQDLSPFGYGTGAPAFSRSATGRIAAPSLRHQQDDEKNRMMMYQHRLEQRRLELEQREQELDYATHQLRTEQLALRSAGRMPASGVPFQSLSASSLRDQTRSESPSDDQELSPTGSKSPSPKHSTAGMISALGGRVEHKSASAAPAPAPAPAPAASVSVSEAPPQSKSARRKQKKKRAAAARKAETTAAVTSSMRV